MSRMEIMISKLFPSCGMSNSGTKSCFDCPWNPSVQESSVRWMSWLDIEALHRRSMNDLSGRPMFLRYLDIRLFNGCPYNVLIHVPKSDVHYTSIGRNWAFWVVYLPHEIKSGAWQVFESDKAAFCSNHTQDIFILEIKVVFCVAYP